MAIAAKTSVKKIRTARRSKKKSHVHVWDIPKSLFFRNEEAKRYRDELARIMSSLRFTNERVQYAGQISAFNIKSITQKNGFIPSSQELFRHVAEFVYHYENYCFRVYAFREKLLLFVNSFLSLNLQHRDVNMRLIENHPIVTDAKLGPILKRFGNKQPLGKIIQERNALTHKLYYGETFDHFFRPKSLTPPVPKSKAGFEEWCRDWRREIMTRTKSTVAASKIVSDINHELAQKLTALKSRKHR